MKDDRNPLFIVVTAAVCLGILFGLWMKNVWAGMFMLNAIMFLNAYIKDLLK
jgi:hypothetical protein